MAKPVLDGELAPNVAIQFRLGILMAQSDVDEAWINYKTSPCLETFQVYYSCIGGLISKMISAPVFKDVEEVWKTYREIKNSLTSEAVMNDSFVACEDVHFGLNDVIKNSPIYDFEFKTEEAIDLKPR